MRYTELFSEVYRHMEKKHYMFNLAEITKMTTEPSEASFDEDFIGTEVTTSHYVPATEREKCQNKTCGTKFMHRLRRPHHCRRCGEIFCRPCVQYSRRLNVMAQPDHQGVPCKVCLACFEDRVLNLGCTTRSHTQVFHTMRRQAKEEIMDIEYEYELVTRHASEQPRFWREQFSVDILKECIRLLQGFESAIRHSQTLAAVGEIQRHVHVPVWQQSTFWMLERCTTRCRQCGGKLEHRKKIRNCRVCGLALCKLCSQKELLLYFEDGDRRDKTATPNIAIIRIIGSPDVKPRLSLLLYCCSECKDEIVDRQIEDDRWYMKKPKPPDLASEMMRMDETFRQLTNEIRNDTEKICTAIMADPLEMTEEIMDDVDDKCVFKLVSNMQSFSIHGQGHGKLEVLKENANQKLRTYCNLYGELTSLLKESSDNLRMSQLVKNYFKAKNAFYVETMSRLAKLTKQ